MPGKALTALVWMVAQYLEERDGSLYNCSMTAGELAFEALYEAGLITSPGPTAHWTEEGRRVLNSYPPHSSSSISQ